MVEPEKTKAIRRQCTAKQMERVVLYAKCENGAKCKNRSNCSFRRRPNLGALHRNCWGSN